MSNIVRFRSVEDERIATVEGRRSATVRTFAGPVERPQPDVVRFQSFEVDLDSGQLRKRGSRVRLPGHLFQVLTCLLEHHGRVVSREDLRRRLWSDSVFVDFNNGLNTAIARLRQVLGDSVEHPSFIETVPKYGYRFIADVYMPPPRGGASARKARLRVLPFAHRSSDTAERFVTDAITDDLLTTLATVAPESLAVIARTPMRRTQNLADIPDELDVDYIVEGQVRCSGDRAVINVRLAQASDQACVYARSCDADMGDLTALPKSIAREIVEHILRENPTSSPRILHAEAVGPTDEPRAACAIGISGRCRTSRSETPGRQAAAPR